MLGNRLDVDQIPRAAAIALAVLVVLAVPATAVAGDLIAFANGQSRVCVATDTGKNERCITSKRGYDVDVTSSPDGKRIAYAHGRPGNDECGYQIRIVKPDGSSMRELTCFDGNDRAPAFTRDGKTIYFDRQEAAVIDIWRVNVNGKNLKQVTDTPLIGESQAVPSPTENQIAFTISEASELQIWLATKTGTDYSQLTFGPDDHFDATYAPDGGRILFTKRPDGFSGDTDLEFITSGMPQPLATTDNDESDAAYSSDGKRIVYSVGDAIWTMRANGTKKRRVKGLEGGYPSFVKR